MNIIYERFVIYRASFEGDINVVCAFCSVIESDRWEVIEHPSYGQTSTVSISYVKVVAVMCVGCVLYLC